MQRTPFRYCSVFHFIIHSSSHPTCQKRGERREKKEKDNEGKRRNKPPRAPPGCPKTSELLGALGKLGDMLKMGIGAAAAAAGQ